MRMGLAVDRNPFSHPTQGIMTWREPLHWSKHNIRSDILFCCTFRNHFADIDDSVSYFMEYVSFI